MKRIVRMNQMFLRRVGLSVGLGLLFLCLCIAPAMAERVVLPESLTEIADEAFLNNASITSVEIPFGAERIGARAFAGCGNLDMIKIPDSVTFIGEEAFAGCGHLYIECSLGSPAAIYAQEQGIPFGEYINTEIPEGLQYEVYDQYAVITGYSGSDREIIIPDQIEGVPVTEIGADAFRNNYKIERVVLSDNITTIGSYAFFSSNLADIQWGKGIQNLGEYAFAHSNLEKLVIPGTIEEIAPFAFWYCYSLSDLTISEGVTAIGQEAFRSAEISEISFPDSIHTLGDGAFGGCDNLTRITTPRNWDSILSQNEWANNSPFYGCMNLAEITVPDGVTALPDGAFNNCYALEDVYLPDSLISIGQYAFAHCDQLKQIVLPSAVSFIDYCAFYWSGIENIEFPENLETLAYHAFSYCDNLKEITTPVNWNSTFTSDGWNGSPFEGCANLRKVVVPHGATVIPDDAFYNCESIETVQLPSSLECIYGNAFRNCTQLTHLDIPDRVSEIWSDAFSGSGLVSINLPDALTNVTGFEWCTNLVSVSLPANLTSISSRAFYNCTSLQRISIPDSVYSIGGEAFGGCSSLMEVNYPIAWDNLYSWTNNIKYPFNACTNLTTVQVTDGTTHISPYAFGNTGLTDIYLPPSVTSVGEEAFAECPDTLTIYGVSGSYAETYAAENGISFSTDPFPGFEDEEPDEPETPGTITFSGYVTFEDGMPLPDVEIYAYNAAEELIDYDCTDDDGAWSCKAIPDEQCTIRYYHDVYTIEPTEVGVITSDDMVFDTAIASVGGVYGPAVPSFTMQINGEDIPAEGVMVGDPVTFTITADNMTKVRLVADGRVYDEYYLIDGSATFDRSFSRAGERAIAFQAYTGIDWTIPCEVQTLSVVSYGTLDAPVYKDITSHYAGEELTVDWTDVENAEEYVIRVYYNQIPQILLRTTASEITIPGTVFPVAGQYSVSVMATGFGYSQSGTDDLFDVILPDYQLTMASPSTGDVYVVGDRIDVNLTQSGGGYLAVKVVPPDGRPKYYPLTDSGTTTEEQVWIPITATQTGTYAITPYIYSNAENPDASIPAISGETVYVQVLGPNIREIKPGNGNYTWVSVDSAQSFTITANNAVDQIDIYEDDILLFTSSTYDEDPVTYIRTFNLTSESVPKKGEHTYIIKGTDHDANVFCEEQTDFYVVEFEDLGRKVYAQAESITLYSSPLNGENVATVNGGTNIETLTVIGDAGTWYYVKTKTGVTGFAPYDLLSDQAWENASGKIEIIYPTQGSSIPLSGESLIIRWNTGLVRPEGSYLSVKLQSLVGGNTISAGVSSNSYQVPISNLEEDSYSLQVSLKKDDVIFAESEIITFNVGNFSLDESYKDWWKNSLLGNYNICVDMGEKFLFTYLTGNTAYLNRPLMIREPATLAYTKLMEDQKDIRHDNKYNSDSNWYLMSNDARDQMALLTISESMMNEIGKNKLVLKIDLSNASAVAQSSQTAAENKATAELVTNTIEGVMNGVKVYITVQSAGNQHAQNVLSLVDLVFDSVSSAVDSYIDQNNVIKQINAYADQYVESMLYACDLYIEYLEETYQNELAITENSRYKTYVEQYISAFRQLRSDPENLREIAVRQLLESSGSDYTWEELEELNNGMKNNALSLVDDDFIYEIIIQCFDAAAQIVGSQTGIPIDVEFASYKDGEFVINWSQLVSTAGQTVLTVLLDYDFKMELSKIIELKFRPETEKRLLRSLNGSHNAALKQINSIAIFSTVLELGENIYNIADSGSELVDQSNNKGMYDIYGQMMIEAFNCHKDVVCASGLSYEMTDQHIDSMNIQDLEYRRKAMVSLMNFDINLMVYYRNMRTINEKNGFKFNNDIDWLTLDKIDARKEYFMRVRDLFIDLPDVYKSLFSE